MFSATFLLLFVTSVLSEDVSNPLLRDDGRIVGGVQTDITEAPYQVSLSSSKFGHFCGGSIIAKKWILTAAHCTDSYKHHPVPPLQVRVGSSRRLSGGELINVKKIHQHSQFSMKTIDYDFALLELAKDLSFDKTKKPISLPHKDHKISEGAYCKVTGWGLDKNKVVSFHLQETNVPVENHAKCKQAYKGLGTVTDRMFCAGFPAGGKDACQGDSGGPSVHNNMQVGVVSWGHGCAKAGYPGIYAKVSSVRSWIKQISGV